MKVLGVSDSDSYTKWGASILDRMPADRLEIRLLGAGIAGGYG